MHVTLSHEHQSFVQQLVESGVYATPTDVLNEALLLLRERKERETRLNRLREDIALGVQEAQQGRLIAGKEAVALVRANF